MQTLWASVRTGTLVLLLALGLSACGGSPGTASPTAPAATSAATTAATTAATSAATSAATTAATSVATSVPATEAELLYIDQGVLYAWRGDGEPERLGDVPGTVFAAALAGDNLLVLNEQGVLRIKLADGSQKLVLSAPSPVQFGSLLRSSDGSAVIYAAVVADPSAPFGSTLVGRYRAADDTVQPLLTADRVAQPLGLSRDGTLLYVLPRGQDPAFGTVQAVALDSGTIAAELPVQGEGIAVLSPDGRYILATARRLSGDANDPGTDLLYLYDLTAANISPRELTLPRAPSATNSIVWAPDSSAAYLALGAGNIYALSESYGLWRLDIASDEATQVSDVDVLESRLELINPAGTSVLLRQNSGAAVLIDVNSGATTTLPIPPTAIVAGWRE